MVNKKIFIVILIIIAIASCIILINNKYINDSMNNHNVSENHTSKNMSNKILKNNSTNNKTVDFTKNYKSVISSKNNNLKNKLVNNSNEVTAEDIKKLVEENVYWSDGVFELSKDNVRIGLPYKYEEGSWLVPAYNKATGKFLGAVWVDADTHKDRNGKFSRIFSNGPDSYSDYKKIISGKEIKFSDLIPKYTMNSNDDSNLNNNTQNKDNKSNSQNNSILKNTTNSTNKLSSTSNQNLNQNKTLDLSNNTINSA